MVRETDTSETSLTTNKSKREAETAIKTKQTFNKPKKLNNKNRLIQTYEKEYRWDGHGVEELKDLNAEEKRKIEKKKKN